jgi:predicted dehydrogenase
MRRARTSKSFDDGHISRFRLCTIELFLDRHVTREPRPLTWMAYESEGGGLLGARLHYIDGLRHWFGEVVSVAGRLAVLRPDRSIQVPARSSRPKRTTRSCSHSSSRTAVATMARRSPQHRPAA